MLVAVAASKHIAHGICLPSAKTTKSWRYFLVQLLFIARNFCAIICKNVSEPLIHLQSVIYCWAVSICRMSAEDTSLLRVSGICLKPLTIVLLLILSKTFVFSIFSELIQSRGVCRLSVRVSVCLSVNFFAQIAFTTTKMARSLPNLHTMVSRWTRIQVVLKVKIKGHVIRALLCWT